MTEPTPNIAEIAVPEGAHKYTFGVAMSCGGCSGAVTRVLKKLDGIEAYDVDLKTQTATVITKPDADLPYSRVLEVISKTGKKVNTGNEDGEERPIVV